jgi:uncharacterized membrane-anchored protein
MLPFFGLGWRNGTAIYSMLGWAQRAVSARLRPNMDPLTIALLIIAGGILLGPRVLFAVILIPTALFIGLLALLLVIGGTVLVARDERRRAAMAG